MNEQTLEQRIALWKAIATNDKGETDTFINALVNRADVSEKVCEIAKQIVAGWESGEPTVPVELRMALFKAVVNLDKIPQ